MSSAFANSLCLASANLRTTTKVKHVSRSFSGDSICLNEGNALGQGVSCVLAPLGLQCQSKKPMKEMRQVRLLCAADSNKVATDVVSIGSENMESTLNENQSLAAKTASLISATGNAEVEVSARDETGSQMQGADSGGTQTDSEGKTVKVSSLSVQSLPKRSPLTAREKLRAARVLNKFTESRPSKREMGRSVLDALRESDVGKPRGLPQAPTNLFDDSKRGMPKQGLTFDFPGGVDLFVIVFSFVFISSVMFATTYIVWKAGAIHFNE
ncbi:hypothetical protein MRB53_011306 [Persea americana]|uniref:Uncharacterized protein n=1 Tax=Persea americana TaxID=3435 RepID=A0ACC2LUM7_PERAE|nr:hypothetical protein MRB53_011306 [Persea americana]